MFNLELPTIAAKQNSHFAASMAAMAAMATTQHCSDRGRAPGPSSEAPGAACEKGDRPMNSWGISYKNGTIN